VTLTVRFDRVGHLVRVPVTIGGTGYRLLLDTGAGMTVVSSAVAARPDVRATGETATGRRMSGQELTFPCVELPRLDVGGFTATGHLAAVADLGPADGPEGHDGLLGYSLFLGHAVTTDPAAGELTITPADRFDEPGTVVPLEVRDHGHSLDPFVRLVLPSGREVLVELDTGSQSLILHDRYAEECGVDLAAPGLETRTGTDETGGGFVRRWATIDGAVHLAGAPGTAQERPRVMFQEIIHDGLLGTDFLERFRFTVDLGGSRLVLSEPPTLGTLG
jgi:predicted aspartyl protease